MRQGKNPTVAQKEWLSSKGLNFKEWLIVTWGPTDVTICHRKTKEVKELPM